MSVVGYPARKKGSAIFVNDNHLSPTLCPSFLLLAMALREVI